MRLIFIRHGDPDYSIDSLTEAGFREAACLAKRAAHWPVTAVYCSPLGRAQDTARPCLEAWGLQAETLDWLREVTCGKHTRPDGSNRETSVLWDLLPDYWTQDPLHFDPAHWCESAYFQAVYPEAPARFQIICNGIDGILARYGYLREDRYYRIAETADRAATLVFFCHLGQIGASAGHVLNLSPMQLWHSFWLSPTSVTVLNSEERQGDKAGFRCQVMGDVSHLTAAGEPVSPQGGFSDGVFEL